MKKTFTIIIAIIVLVLCFGIVSSAETEQEIDLTRGLIAKEFSDGTHIDGYDVSMAFDGIVDYNSRWAATQNSDWIQVSFEKKVIVTAFQINECKDWGIILDFDILAEVDGNWVTVYEGTETVNEKIALSAPVETTAIRLLVNSHSNTVAYGATVFEMNVFGFGPVRPILTSENTFTATASTLALPAADAFDGVVGDATSGFASRWASDSGDINSWIEITFDNEVDFSAFSIIECAVWGNVESYNIQVLEDGEYVTVYTGEKIQNKIITLDKTYTTTKIRFNCLSINMGRYAGISLYEIQYLGKTPDEVEQQPDNGGNETPVPNPPTGDMSYIVLLLVAMAVTTAYSVFRKQTIN